MKPSRSITETPNPLTGDIDLASPLGIVRLLRQTDAQIFAGYGTYAGIYDNETLDRMAQLAEWCARILAQKDGLVVLSGAGTSGRLAMFITREFNHLSGWLQPSPFRFLLAGGPPALIQAQEGAEDDPYQAQRDLETIAQSREHVFYVGITCGFSAPYIAGQLEYALQQPNWKAVLLGFNPLELARTTSIEGWPWPFKATAEKVAAAPNGALLNPVIGPEPITGSTRMKSGTATKMLLEVLFTAVRLHLIEQLPTKEQVRLFVRNAFERYERAYRSTYHSISEMAELVALGGATLRAKGHIYYLGGAGRSAQSSHTEPDAGILGLIDASECPPTFGAAFEDVRGFVQGGWRTLYPDCSVDPSGRAPHYRVSLEDFRNDKLPQLSENDLCVILGNVPAAASLIPEIRKRGAKCTAVAWREEATEGHDVVVNLGIEEDEIFGVGTAELGFKLVLNALTTGAHILAGKVYGNRMVDLRISNNKLFHRTLGIIMDLIGVDMDTALEALLRAIFETDNLTTAQRNASISECIEVSQRVEKVVPKALLLATGLFDYQQASDVLTHNPIVRMAISEHVSAERTTR